MTALLQQARAAIRRHALVLPDQRVLVAVSGGADSVCLLHVLVRLAPLLHFEVVVLHMNHGLRGDESDGDEAFVRRLARELEVPFVRARADVRKAAARRSVSIEMAARDARYAFFARSARALASKAGESDLNRYVTATAHTADDQAETILLKITRGAGMRGLTGIPRITTAHGLTVVRPLLDIPHEAAVDFLEKNGAEWREDSSNEDDTFLRNRIRHHVLPLLETRINPAVRQALARTAEILYEDDQWLDELSAERLEGVRMPPAERGGGEDLNAAELAKLPAAARRRVLRLWLSSSGIDPATLDFGTVDRLERSLASRRRQLHTEIGGGWVAVRAGHRIVLRRPGEKTPRSTAFREKVCIPGRTTIARVGIQIDAEIAPGIVRERSHLAKSPLPASASLSLAALGRRKLFVRSWRPGDRMAPLGMNGSRKLQDIFTDAKVAPELRTRLPVFVCAGAIVWLPGFRVARGWQVRDGKEAALQLCVDFLVQE